MLFLRNIKLLSWHFLLKSTIFILSYGFIGYKLYNTPQLFKGFLIFSHNTITWLYFLLFLFLISVNWGLESLKWQKLIKPLQSISYITSYKAVLSGITMAIFTPNRVGEYGGRIFVLERKNRLHGILSTMVGSIAQILATLFFSIIAMFLWFQKSDLYSEIKLLANVNIYVFPIILLSICLIYLFFHLHLINKILNRFFSKRKFIQYFEILSKYKKVELIKVLIFSLLRYLVFVLQFYLLILATNTNLSFVNCFMGVGLLYLALMIVPTIALSELGVRGSLALIIFTPLVPDVSSVLLVSVFMWFFNLAIPALIGGLIFSKMKI